MKILSLFWHNVISDSHHYEHYNGSEPTVSIFKEQIRFIIDKYTPISIVDFIKIAEDRRLLRSYSKPPVLLGFDDGFKNIINLALPIMKDFNVPALFFVNGEIIKNSDFVPWHVELKYLPSRSNKKIFTYDNVQIDLNTKKGYRLLLQLFGNSFRSCSTDKDRQRVLTKFAESLDVERPSGSQLNEDLRLATKDDLTNLGENSLLTVASHAMTHKLLGYMTREEQIYELEKSDLLLRENIPSYYPTISYPNGSFNSDTLVIAKRIYRCAFAVLEGSSRRNLYVYPRIGLGQHNARELAHITSYRQLRYIRPVRQFIHDIGIKKLLDKYRLKIRK